MILLIDNYDSFVHNLARYFRLQGKRVEVLRNDDLHSADIPYMNPEAIVISPGPCAPSDAGQCNNLIVQHAPNIPILGVCLGHQCIGEVFGGNVVKSAEPVHGRSSEIYHDGTGLFSRLPQPFIAGRYHSLCVELRPESPLIVNARTADGTIMGLEHPDYPCYGVQFHPESILTPQGMVIIQNFLESCKAWHSIKKAA